MSPRRTLIAALAVISLAAISVAAGTAVPAVATAPGRAQAESPGLRLASQTAWVGAPGTPTGQFVLRLLVSGVDRPEQAQLTVRIYPRVRSRSHFVLTLGGNGLGTAIHSSAARLADLLPGDAVGAVTVRLDPAAIGITRVGVYPVAVGLRLSDDEVSNGESPEPLVTHLLYVPAQPETDRLGLAWILPFHAPPALQPDGTRRLQSIEHLATLVEQLEAAPYRDIPLVVAPTAETVDAIARRDSENDRAVLDSLRAALRGRQVITGPFVPVDVAALTDAGIAGELNLQLQRSKQVVADVLETRPDTRTWLSGSQFDQHSVSRLFGLQVDRLVVPEAALAPITLQVTLAQPFSVEGRAGRRLPAVAADPGLAAHFERPGDPVLAAHHLLADLVVLWLDAPQRTRAVVAMTPRSWKPNRAFLDAVLAGLARSPVVAPATLDAVFALVEPATTSRGATLIRRFDSAARPGLGVSTGAVTAIRRRLEAFGSTLRDGSDSEVYRELDKRFLLTQGAEVSARNRRAYLTEVGDAIQVDVDKIRVPRGRTVTLTARQGAIPLTLLNESDQARRVVVRVDSDKLEFPDGTQKDAVDLLPKHSTTVNFKVRARTSGAFPLRISLVSPDGGLQLAATRFTVRSTAASGVGVLLSAGAAVFLAAWWARHLVRGRRARRLLPASRSTTEPA